MATDKKSFLLYCDLIHTVNELPDDKAGELFKHILSYVNDENPTTSDLVIKISFEPIRQQLKRDLKKYEQIRERNAANARKRWDATACERIPNSTKNADSGSDTGNDTDSDKETDSVVPQLHEVIDYFTENGYTKASAEKAFKYYNDAMIHRNGRVWKDGKGNTVKSWKGKMVGVWFKDENKAPKKFTPKPFS